MTNDLRRQIAPVFGPLALLERFFAAAETAADDLGILLTIEQDFDALLAFNQTQRESWYPLTPMYDPRLNRLTPENSFWISGRDSRGDIVATQCARFYDWRGTDFKAEFESLRLAYAEPATCAAPSAAQVTGPVVFSGAGWYRPDYRGKGLSSLLPRISRALALTRWDTDFTYSFIEPKLVEKGIAARYGYTNIEPGIEWLNSFRGSCAFCLLWMPRDQLLADMQVWLGGRAEADEPSLPDRQSVDTG
ncbi:hypothetical protein HBA54_08850 [Pelagibius litoralis]|uniref:Uncharacterized protein n=1 Tax=Pelagibius litoralis TaxID=374515 RepID=A0A967CBY9_9PROT|nr:hypothetical protein [Pelagibius litoralis]